MLLRRPQPPAWAAEAVWAEVFGLRQCFGLSSEAGGKTVSQLKAIEREEGPLSRGCQPSCPVWAADTHLFQNATAGHAQRHVWAPRGPVEWTHRVNRPHFKDLGGGGHTGAMSQWMEGGGRRGVPAAGPSAEGPWLALLPTWAPC